MIIDRKTLMEDEISGEIIKQIKHLVHHINPDDFEKLELKFNVSRIPEESVYR